MAKIITFKHPTLRKKAVAVKLDQPDLNKILREMNQAMKQEEGIGLAAPQIGKSLRLVTIKTDEGPLTLINPKITKKSIRKCDMEEGCLSFPGFFGIVGRPRKVQVCFSDKTGKKVNLAAEGILARVLQHEIDHLDGKLFIYKIKKFTKGDRDELFSKMQS
ncbi:MAG: peptide deformylase [Patescibacteria group bacterium]